MSMADIEVHLHDHQWFVQLSLRVYIFISHKVLGGTQRISLLIAVRLNKFAIEYQMFVNVLQTSVPIVRL